MVGAFEELADLRRVALDPFMPIASKVAIVDAVLKGSEATEITKRLFGAAFFWAFVVSLLQRCARGGRV